jgi:hypothetical protein
MRLSREGRIQNIVWVDAVTTIQYRNLSQEHNIASNVLMAKVLEAAIRKVCEACRLPEVICRCEKRQCVVCKAVFITADEERMYCSLECQELHRLMQLYKGDGN